MVVVVAGWLAWVVPVLPDPFPHSASSVITRRASVVMAPVRSQRRKLFLLEIPATLAVAVVVVGLSIGAYQ